MQNRGMGRCRLKVIHRQQTESGIERQVSELIFVGDQPRLVFGWIDLGGMRTPLFLPLDPRKLHRLRVKNIYHYSGITKDPLETQVAEQEGDAGEAPSPGS